MAEESKELEVDLPEVEKTDGEPIVETAKKADAVDEGIDDLKRQLEAEKAERLAAESRARQAAQTANEASERAHRATTEARDSNLNLVTGAIEQLKATQDLLEERYEQAAAAGDHRAMAKITREFSDNGAKLSQLELGKQEMERTPKDEPRRQEVDPVEQVASSAEASGSPRSARWIREHPEYVRDPNLNRKMLAAHNLAVADGIKPDTDEYFDAVETTLRLRSDEGGTVVDTTPKPRQSAPPAAPSSRAAATNGSTNPNRVRLTSDEVEMAEMMGLTPQEYAKHKVALKSEGRLN
jgi:hypothetical protein